MGVELRSIQRKFHSFMGEVQPSIRPRFIVWLDERLAEFKIKGEIDFSETVDDPLWLKSYYSSKCEAKSPVVLNSEKRNDGSSIHSPLQSHPQSSSSVPHPSVLEWLEDKSNIQQNKPATEAPLMNEEPKPIKDSENQPVEVKQEELEKEEDDDDMIIVGETSHPPVSQTHSIQNTASHRPIYSRYRINCGSFPRKWPRLGKQSQGVNTLSGNHHKSCLKRTVRTVGHYQTDRPYSTHSITSQCVIPSISLSQSYEAEPLVVPVDTSQVYDANDHPTSFDSRLALSASESLPISPHMQSQSGEVDLLETSYSHEGEIYTEYGEEYYDSSYLSDPTETSLQFEQGCNVDRTSLHECRLPQRAHKRVHCEICFRSFTQQSSLKRHIHFTHLNSSDFMCSYCDRNYSSATALDGHMNASHLNHRPYTCRFCTKGFSHKACVNRHEKTCKYKTKA